jgi:hypothetical protein
MRLRRIERRRRRMTKINQHRDIPPTAPPVNHNSGSVKSTPAGGEVSRDQWQKPVPIKHGGGGKSD